MDYQARRVNLVVSRRTYQAIFIFFVCTRIMDIDLLAAEDWCSVKLCLPRRVNRICIALDDHLTFRKLVVIRLYYR